MIDLRGRIILLCCHQVAHSKLHQAILLPPPPPLPMTLHDAQSLGAMLLVSDAAIFPEHLSHFLPS